MTLKIGKGVNHVKGDPDGMGMNQNQIVDQIIY